MDTLTVQTQEVFGMFESRGTSSQKHTYDELTAGDEGGSAGVLNSI